MNRAQIADQLSAQEDAARLRLDRATKAKQLLESGLMKEAFDGVRAAILEEIERARLDQDVSDLRKGLVILKQVKGLLQRHVESGKIATADLEHIGHERKRHDLLGRLRRVA